MRIAVMGAGSIGGVVGAYLAKGNEDVVLVDTYKEHVKAMNERGMKIDGVVDETIPVKAITPDELSGKLDLVFFCVKAINNKQALNMLLPYLGPDSVAVSLQNGINEDEIASIIGKNRTIGGITSWGAAFVEPAHITKLSQGNFDIGELDGTITARVKEIANILSKVEPVEVSDNIYGHLWSKLLINASMSGLGTVCGWTFGETIDNEQAMLAAIFIWKEGYAVAKALGINPAPIQGADPKLFAPEDKQGFETAKQLAVIGLEQQRALKASMWQDIEQGRKTEVDYLNGYIVSKGKEVSIQTPVNETVTRMIKEIETGRRKMSPQNLEEIKLPPLPTE
ncbi:MAG: 2-dehydropantoate 2-reductase [Dehalococcoidia bacterium]|nr:2-dehydropantoate 2-reductase [Dehalococcoidia bacterium]